MKRILKSIVIFLAVILIIPYLVPTKFYKNIIENRISSLTGTKQLLINGDIRLNLLPFNITFNEIILNANPGFVHPLLKMDKLIIKPRIKNLLKGEFYLSKLIVENPIVYIEKSINNKLNWDFLFNKKVVNSNELEPNKIGVSVTESKEFINEEVGNLISSYNATSNNSNNSIHKTSNNIEVATTNTDQTKNEKINDISSLIMKQVELINGKVIIINQNYKETEVDKINLTVKLHNKDSLLHFIMKANFLNQPLMLKGYIKEISQLIPITLNLDFIAQNIYLDGHFDKNEASLYGIFKWMGHLNDIRLSKKNIPYKFGGRLAVNRDIININHLYIDIAKINNINGEINYQILDKIANWDLKTEQTNFIGSLKQLASNKSNDLSSRLSFSIEKLSDLLAKLGINNQDLLYLAKEPINFSGDIIYGENYFQVNQLVFQLLKAHLYGNIAIKNWNKDLTIDYLLQTDKNKELTKKFLGIENNLPIKIHGGVKYHNNSYVFNNQINILDNYLQLVGDIILKHPRSDLNLTIKSNNVNLDKIFSKQASLTWQDSDLTINSNNIIKVADHKTQWSDAKFNFSIIEQFNGEIKLLINKLSYRNFVLQDINIPLLIKDGLLTLLPTKLSVVDGGIINLKGTLLTKGDNLLSLLVSASNVSLKNIIPSHQKFSITNGMVNGNLEITGKLLSANHFFNTLQGKIVLDANDGIVNGINLHKIMDSLQNISKPELIFKNILSAWKSGETRFDKLIIDAIINSGILKINSCVLNSDKITTTTIGNINLPDYTLNTTTTVQVMDYPHLDIKVSGDLNNPKQKILADAFIGNVMKNVVNSLIDKAKSGKFTPKKLLKQAITGFSKNKPPSDPEDSSNKTENQVKQTIQNKVNNLFKKIKKF